MAKFIITIENLIIESFWKSFWVFCLVIKQMVFFSFM